MHRRVSDGKRIDVRPAAPTAGNYSKLKEAGWKVLIIWECELKKNVAEENLNKLYDQIVN